ncbi:leucine aminopeptidase 2, chloroplastic [Zea mays]|nr:leucine aminopeptidase 2, chloroplastic [Zea mays]|eukprot:XP_020398478.1 leucine aminopeptidase 2, chloroplastic [Zea mays]
MGQLDTVELNPKYQIPIPRRGSLSPALSPPTASPISAPRACSARRRRQISAPPPAHRAAASPPTAPPPARPPRSPLSTSPPRLSLYSRRATRSVTAPGWGTPPPLRPRPPNPLSDSPSPTPSSRLRSVICCAYNPSPTKPADTLVTFFAKDIEFSEWKGDILAITITEKDLSKDAYSKFENAVLKKLDGQLGGLLSEAGVEEDFTGKTGQSVVLRLAGQGFKRVGLIGLGQSASSTAAASRGLRESVASVAKAAQASSAAIVLASPSGIQEEFKLAALQSSRTVLGLYEDSRYKSESKKVHLKHVDIIGVSSGAKVDQKLKYANDLSSGVIFGRELVNSPANVLTPAVLAEEASKIASTFSDVFTATVLDVEKCKELKMGSYLGVAAASANPPHFIHLCYKPTDGNVKRKLAIVGKGLTFDSGGYNIKTGPGYSIELMKFDMGGSAAVFGAAKALGQIKPPGVEVHFIVAACENMISGTGMRTGDIVTASNGKTIEGSSGQYVCATLPYIRANIPIIIVFRALGFVADKGILEHICYDFSDTQMMELLRPSLEEAFVIQNQQVALDYIGKHGATVGVTREKRIKYAKEILQKEMLRVGELCETKKAYYFGYIIHRLLMCALSRRAEDDRDHYGNKRLDLAGPLLGGLFRMLFRKLTRDVRSYMQKSNQKLQGLREELNAIVPYLEEMRKKKVERWDQFVDVIEQIKKVASEIRPADFVPFRIPVDQSDMSLRKLEELTKELQSLQKEKSDRLKQVMEHLNTLHSLCEVLGVDFKQTVNEVLMWWSYEQQSDVLIESDGANV